MKMLMQVAEETKELKPGKRRKRAVQISRKLTGYFTVEASLTFLLVLGVVCFVISLLFFQYNRCLQEQKLAGLLLRVCDGNIQTKEARIREWNTAVKEAKADRPFAAWKEQEYHCSIKGNVVTVEGGGTLLLPMDLRSGSLSNRRFVSHVTYTGWIQNPIFYIRTIQKIRDQE